MDLSIIVPVYNTPLEKLIRCFNSIREIKGIAYEAIIVDDGSENETAAFCSDYAQLHDEFIYIRQENKGVSAARNVGICNSTGTFIMFVDADDEIIPGALQDICAWQDSDIVIFDFNASEAQHIMRRKVFPSILMGELSKKNCIEAAYQNKLNTVWAKLFRRSRVVENKIVFDESMVSAEDAKFVLEMIVSVRVINYAPMPAYQYYVSSKNGNNRLLRYPEILQRNAVQLYVLRRDTLDLYGTIWGLSNEEKQRFQVYAGEAFIKFIFQITGSLLNMGMDNIGMQDEIIPQIRNIFTIYGNSFSTLVRIKCTLLLCNSRFLIRIYAYLRELRILLTQNESFIGG